MQPQKPYFIKVCEPVQNTFSVLTFRLKNSNQRLIFSFQPYTYLNALYIKITNQLSIQNNPTRSSSLRNTSDYIYIIRHNPHFVKYYFEPTEIRNSNTYESLIIFFSSVISIPFCESANTVSLFPLPSDNNKRSYNDVEICLFSSLIDPPAFSDSFFVKASFIFI